MENNANSRLARFFAPKSIAIVGASEQAYWSRNAFANLSTLGFAGRIVPVNPSRAQVFGRECIPSLRELGAPVDFAYIAAPPGAVPGILADAGMAGVHNAVVIAAGFGESGPQGHKLQRGLVEQATRHGILFLGPNCPGFINIAEGVAAYGQLVPKGLPQGKVSIVLQSGALTTVVLRLAGAYAVGLSKIVCMGNEAVIGAADVLEYLVDDPGTQVVAMFLEQIREGARFLELANRALVRGKSIVVLKAGRTPAGQKAALAHTGAVTGDEAVVDAAFRQVGMIRVRSLEELMITSGLLAQGYDIKGNRMGFVSASGGACDIVADRASDEGLALPEFSAGTRAELAEYLPKFATVQNPLDTAAIDTVRETGTAAVPMDVVAEIASRDPAFDFIVYMGFNVVPQGEPEPGERDKTVARMGYVKAMRQAASRPIIPISLTCLESGPFARKVYEDSGLWMLGGIEFGLMALGHAARWHAARREAADRARQAPAAPRPFSGARPTGSWSEAAGRMLLAAAGVPLVPACLAEDEDAAVAAAEGFNYPVALKICAADIAHKSDIGGVRLGVRSAGEVRDAYATVHRAGTNASKIGVEGVLVSPMRPRGVELLAGVTVDPTFGPTLAVGLGGIWVEALKDVSLAILPVTAGDIERMLRSLRAKAVLDGVRGGPKINIARAAEAIWRIAQAALSLGPDLHALEVNPLWCNGDHVEALDVLVVTETRSVPAPP
ncbi:MAG: acetate--CoA ligase family protein [Alphaproteobacteria bacterium]|nr:acetate--CoA ligase family protein [Alphaproteobacteria bacterium]